MSDVSHVGITVSDLERSIWFYTELLGMEQQRRYVSNIDLARPMWNSPGLERVESSLVHMPNSEQQVQLTQATGDFGVRRERSDGEIWDIGVAHLGFGVDDLESVVARIGQHGFVPRSGQIVRGEGDYEGLLVAYVPDPDGFNVKLVQPAGAEGPHDPTHAGVTVSDLDRSIWYYRDMLGMEVIRRYKGNPELASAMWNAPGVESLEVAWLKMPGLVQHLELREIKGLTQSRIDRRQWDVGFSHVCLGITDLQSLVGRLAEHAIHPRAFMLGAGITTAWVANSHIPDPDGFDLELLQPT